MKSTLIKKPEDSTEDTIIIYNRIDHTDLQDQITQLLIENPLSLDEFLNPEDETVLDKEGDIFEAIVAAYSSNQDNKEGESNDKEEVKQVEDNAALRAIEIVKLWKLQKGTDHDIKALDRIEREIVRYKSSQAYQTTILRFFEPK
jgi:hypothetical protein